MTRNHCPSRVIIVILLCSIAYPLQGQTASKPLFELPIEFEKNLPLVSISVNGASLLFILDSAAASCVIDDEAAAQIGIKAGQSALSSGSGGIETVGLAHGIQLSFPGLDIDLETAVLSSLRGLEFKKPIHGVLGFPLFGKYVVELDYPGRRVRVYNPNNYQAPAAGEIIPLWITDGPTVRGRLKLPAQDPVEADFQVDTGSSHVLTVCKPFVDKHQMLKKVADLKADRTFGLGGSSPDMVGRIESVTVGAFSIQNPEVRFSTHATGTLATERFSANLGNGFLNSYTVIFDLPHSRLILKR